MQKIQLTVIDKGHYKTIWRAGVVAGDVNIIVSDDKTIDLEKYMIL